MNVKKPKTLVDPPEGWKYGFPTEWDGVKPLDILLREHKYPENDIAFALNHMRVIIDENTTS
jgi:hypothetical protein